MQSQIAERMRQMLETQNENDRINEIRQIIKQMDFRWDHGFIMDKDNYIEQRLQLQHELEKLTPPDNDELAVAVDILENFADHWEAIDQDRKQQEKLLKLIVKKVWVNDDKVTAVILRPDFYIDLE